MGAIVSGAVPRLRCPEEANLRAPESVVALHASFIRAGAELIETNTFGANRRKLAAHFLEDDLERDQLRRRPAGARGARRLRAGGLRRRLDRAARRAGELRRRRARAALRRAGGDPRGPRRRPVRDRDLLRRRRARGGGRGGPWRSRRCRSSPCSPSTRTARPSAASARREAAERLSGARRRGDRDEPRRRPARGPDGARRGWATATSRSWRCRTSASRRSPAAGSSTRTRAPLLHRVRGAGALRSARGSWAAAAARRRHRSRRSAARSTTERPPSAPFVVGDRELAVEPAAHEAETAPRPGARRRRLGHVRRARPAEGRHERCDSSPSRGR